MKSLKIMVLGMFLILSVIATNAQEVGTFTNRTGWKPGDKSAGYLRFYNSIKVSLDVKTSTITGKSYYVVSFWNDSNVDVTIGARITDEEPDTTHFSMKIPAGETRKWGEHLETGLTKVWVMVRKNSY